MQFRRTAIAAVALAAPMALLPLAPASADSTNAKVSFGQLFHDGATVRTVATPTSQPGRGVDAIFAFPEGAAAGQLGITSVVPGSRDYHGGRWAVHVVRWAPGVTPRLLTSDEAVHAAAAAGQVQITRMPAADFVCPVAGR